MAVVTSTDFMSSQSPRHDLCLAFVQCLSYADPVICKEAAAW